jgi:signal peptidase I
MRLISFPLSLLVLIVAGCSAITGIQPVRIQGYAMAPSLKEGDHGVFSRRFAKLERGDIVVFYYPAEPSKSYIKRIIGLPDEEIEIRAGKVLINGRNIDEPYVDPKNNLSARAYAPVRIPADSYFVMGDNRDNSNDSRFWGSLPRKFIYGRFVSKY